MLSSRNNHAHFTVTCYTSFSYAYICINLAYIRSGFYLVLCYVTCLLHLIYINFPHHQMVFVHHIFNNSSYSYIWMHNNVIWTSKILLFLFLFYFAFINLTAYQLGGFFRTDYEKLNSQIKVFLFFSLMYAQHQVVGIQVIWRRSAKARHPQQASGHGEGLVN